MVAIRPRRRFTCGERAVHPPFRSAGSRVRSWPRIRRLEREKPVTKARRPMPSGGRPERSAVQFQIDGGAADDVGLPAAVGLDMGRSFSGEPNGNAIPCASRPSDRGAIIVDSAAPGWVPVSHLWIDIFCISTTIMSTASCGRHEPKPHALRLMRTTLDPIRPFSAVGAQLGAPASRPITRFTRLPAILLT